MSHWRKLSPLETLIVQSFAAGCVNYAEIAERVNYSLLSVRASGHMLQRKTDARNLVHLAFMISGYLPAPENLLEALARSDTDKRRQQPAQSETSSVPV